MTYIPHISATLRGIVELPSSKSLSNRALLLGALSGTSTHIERLSTCDDTFVMQRALTERTPVIDIMAAGTAMRFLTAYFALCAAETHTLTGSERMKQRPIGLLVDALRTLGAHIQYTEKEGFPPLLIEGQKLRGGSLSLPAGISSQYISALLMTAPCMDEGLTLTLEGDIISRPYIDMTISLMRTFGADVAWKDNQTLQVAPGGYRDQQRYTVEADWSAASYWYEMVTLCTDTDARIALPHLHADSLQGDSAVARYFAKLGVKTEFVDGVAILTKDAATMPSTENILTLDLVNQPDLAQTLVVTCAMMRRPFRFTGLRSLRIKETDRTAALQNELAKFGISLLVDGDDTLYINAYAPGTPHWNGTPIDTYNDHRMAMAFAPACMVCPGVSIHNPEVVSKSYPDFWNDLQKFA